MSESFPMKSGDDSHSYSKNSLYQKLASDTVKEMIEESVIKYLDTDKVTSSMGSTTIALADFGCSIGPNTFLAVQNLIQPLQTKNLEFQVFFNDHFSNDFNTLLTSLPPERPYHAAAVGGSFYGRLFPRNSLTIAYSSQSLHWLSKPPQGVNNEAGIHGSGAPEPVATAYSAQFEADLGCFLDARAEEIVSGGLMFLVMPATPDGLTQTELSALFDFYGYSLMDLADKGVVEKSRIEEFNLPIHIPRLGEMREVIEKNGCFRIERMELTNPKSKVAGPLDAANVVTHMRSAMEGVFAAHFGASVADQMFDNVVPMTPRIADCFKALHHISNQLFVVLTRK
ncbi:loganic acid O-methyltransferase-like [Salvia splendens]|uniref:loganic acid O-methyltransferase-like n=1 Tax=Salvia splendens TaxID=180675 RepID=UPI00110205BF|nr:loganic acid O-methyltransferase-like [Salvia splendens]